MIYKHTQTGVLMGRLLRAIAVITGGSGVVVALKNTLRSIPHLKLTVLSLRYSSWSMRPWLALTHAGARFDAETVALAHM